MGQVWRITESESSSSTNTDLKLLADAGEAAGRVLWAHQQTAGRGRHGREWHSPLGNLYCSFLVEVNCSPLEAGMFGFVTALAIYDTIKFICPKADIQLKWPNDVLVDGKKISGILIDAAPIYGAHIKWLVIGCGLNVESYPAETLYPATSIRETLALSSDETLPPLKEILERLLTYFNAWQDDLDEFGFPLIRSVWVQRSLKGKMSVKLPAATLEGKFDGIDEDGSLVLQLADGSKAVISAGDVFFEDL